MAPTITAGRAIHPASANLAASNGLITSEALMMWLAETMGRHQPHHIIYAAARTAVISNGSFAEALKSDRRLSHFKTDEIDALLDPGPTR